MPILIRGGTILTGNGHGDILTDGILQIDGSTITSLRSDDRRDVPSDADVVDARGKIIIPGFVQTHIHLCQTLFRGLADDLELLDWLQKKIFPFEATHNAHSMYASAMLGITELIRSGTTTILDMGSVNHEEEVIRAVGESGLRAFVGKAMMDMNDAYPQLKEPTAVSLKTTRDLAERWHNSYDGRVKYAVAPRFVLSCTEKLLTEASEMISSFDGMLFHTHASENTNEVTAVRKRCSMENIEYLHHIHALSDRACLAHCIHLNEKEVGILASTRTNVAHCPSSNLKLGSGIANIPHLVDAGITVSLGADGAPCNNTLDMFQEMRLASLIQKPIYGPTAMPAHTVFAMATRGGATALGIDRVIGTLEIGKKADLVLLDLQRCWNPASAENLTSSIVYSAGPENVDSVMIDGRWVYCKKEFVGIDESKLIANARQELQNLLSRV